MIKGIKTKAKVPLLIQDFQKLLKQNKKIHCIDVEVWQNGDIDYCAWDGKNNTHFKNFSSLIEYLNKLQEE